MRVSSLNGRPAWVSPWVRRSFKVACVGLVFVGCGKDLRSPESGEEGLGGGGTDGQGSGGKGMGGKNLGGEESEGDPKPAPERPPAAPYLGLPQELSTGAVDFDLVPVFEKVTFVNPVGVYPVPGTNHLCVVEREGRVVVFENDPDVDTSIVALDARSTTQGRSDGGMLGIVFHPDFGRKGARHEKSVFINYLYSESPIQDTEDRSSTPTDYRLSRFEYDVKTHTIDPDSEQVLISQYDQNLWHQGGAMFFHPRDGFLYFAVGDEGGGGCRYDNCQIIDKDLFSGVFRLDVDERGGDISHPIVTQPKTGTTAHYYIPNDNPFVGEPDVLEEFYALGLRSPHRMTYDAVDDIAWIGEVGQSAHEELNVLAKAANYQWDTREGFDDNPDAEEPEKIWGNWTAPVLELARSDARSVIGGYVYRGSKLPELFGKFLYADFEKGTLYAVSYRKKDGKLEPGENAVELVKNELLLATQYQGLEDGITSFGYDAQGELYVTTMGESSVILKLEAGKKGAPNVPTRLSKTGFFDPKSFESGTDLATAPAFLKYEVNSPLYSDGAVKSRFFAVPSEKRIRFSENEPWSFPEGSVFLKHFDMALDEREPEQFTRLETRVLVRNEAGIYGMTYRWNTAQTDAELVTEGTTWKLQRTDDEGREYVQRYTLPGPNDCLTCHTKAAGFVLGVRTAQMNLQAHGARSNQLETLGSLGMFTEKSFDTERSPKDYPRLVALDDESANLEQRVRSYWDSNCSMCHQPDHVTRAVWDARIQTPLEKQGVVGVAPSGTAGDDDDFLIAPGDPKNSLLLKRAESTDPTLVMPPLGRRTEHEQFTGILREWIESLD